MGEEGGRSSGVMVLMGPPGGDGQLVGAQDLEESSGRETLSWV